MASKHNVNICMQQKIILLSQGLKLHVKSRAPRLANFTKTCCVVWGDAMIINKYPDNLADHTEDDNTFESPIHNFSFIDIIGHLISLNIYHYSYYTIEKVGTTPYFMFWIFKFIPFCIKRNKSQNGWHSSDVSAYNPIRELVICSYGACSSITDTTFMERFGCDLVSCLINRSLI